MIGISRLLLVMLVLVLFIAPVVAQDDELEANKALAVAWWEAEAAREYDRMGEFFTEDVARHSLATTTVMPETQVTNLEEYTQFLQGTAAMFPDYRFAPQMLAAEGDYVAWYGVFSGTFAENGNSLEVPFAGFFRFEEGKIAEVWAEWDNITWGAQMNEGAPPLPIAGYEQPITGEFDPAANKALVMAFAEAELTRNYDRFDELIAEDFVVHNAATSNAQVNREGLKANLRGTAAQFPDYTYRVQMMVAEGDLVAAYSLFSGTVAATGRAVEFPFIDFYRIQDGKLVERWIEWDDLTVMTQMGVFPPPAAEQPLVGTFTTTITLADIGDYPVPEDLIGEWQIQYVEGGDVIVEFQPEGRDLTQLADTDVYTVTADTLVFRGEDGFCATQYEITSAAYHWTWDGMQLVLSNVDDVCTERIIVSTSHPLVRVDEATLP